MVSYQIIAKESVEVQGLTVNLSAEFEQGGLPEVVDVNGSGQVQTLEAEAVYANISGKYNPGGKSFSYLSGSNLTDGFIGEVSAALDAFFEEVKSEQGGVA